MANQNYGSYAGLADDFAIDPSLLAGYSTDASMTSQQTITSLAPAASAPDDDDVEFNSVIRWHKKVDYVTYDQHPTKGYYYVRVPPPAWAASSIPGLALAPASAPESTAPFIAEAQMYDPQVYEPGSYAFADSTMLDAYENTMPYYAEAQNTAYPIEPLNQPVSPVRPLSSRNTPEQAPEFGSSATPRVRRPVAQRLTRDEHYRAYRERQKSTIQRQKPSIQRGTATTWAKEKAKNHARRRSVIKACTCAHNPYAAFSDVKRPSNSWVLFRSSTTFPEEVLAFMDVETRYNCERGKRLSVEKASALWKIIQDGDGPMFAAVRAEYKKKAQAVATGHETDNPNYHYRPTESAAYDFGDENCVCGAREINMSARRDRQAGITSNKKKKKSVKPSASRQAKPRYDSDSEELSDPPTDLDSDDGKLTPRASSGYGAKRTPQNQRSNNSKMSDPPSPAPTPSKRPTRGAKAPIKTVARKTVIKPSPYKGYAYEVVEEDEDEDEDMEE